MALPLSLILRIIAKGLKTFESFFESPVLRMTCQLRKKIAATILVLLACYASVEGFRFLAGPKGKLVMDRRVSSRAKGSPKAPVWIVEYIDFQCGTCGRASKVLGEYLEKYPSQIYLQVRFRPLVLSHEFALKSAIYAECAASQGRFWAFYEILFARQKEWASSGSPDGYFHAYAEEIGMDPKRLDACIGDEAVRKRVVAEKDEAMDLGVKSTPTFFINGNMIVGIEALKGELEAAFPEKEGSAS